MKDHDYDMSFDDWDELHDPRPEECEFDRVVEAAMSRRGFLGGVLAVGSGAAVMGTLMSSTSAEASSAGRFAFKPIGIATDGTVRVPEGYKWAPLAKWGQPLFPGMDDLDHATGSTSDHAAKSFGENTDGMHLFNVRGHEVIAVNHEYPNPKVNLPNNDDGVPTSADDVLKLQNVQGVAVFEIEPAAEGWQIKTDSPFNRRITQNTPMRISGPAAGHDLLKTPADPTGTMVLGTMNNCGSGKTPWGTYLTCEENFNGYFGTTEEVQDQKPIELPDGYARYGINPESRYSYEKFDPRFDFSQNPNEPHRFGWVVEIDPSDPDSTPVKRTALGRFKHENAEVALAPDGRVVVYLGDDERGEYLYKFVSAQPYVPGTDTSTLLDDGSLFVAKFEEDGTGRWIELTPEATGMDAQMILIHTRMAASAVGATTMDRPEWVAVNPVAVEGYCALTNNKNRGIKTNAGGDPTPVGGPNPRAENRYGQVVRWRPENDDHADPAFTWDLYVMAGNPEVHSDAYAGSDNMNAGNLFNSPDCVAFDSTGLLWIQTDGNYKNEGDFAGMGNNQMLAGDPVTGQIERFLTGPFGCEVTGLTWSSDRRTMFAGMQHPFAPFPDGDGKLPRSTVVAIWREDGAPVG